MAKTTTLALHTAVTFLVLWIGILFTRPDRGLMQVINEFINRGTDGAETVALGDAFAL